MVEDDFYQVMTRHAMQEKSLLFIQGQLIGTYPPLTCKKARLP